MTYKKPTSYICPNCNNQHMVDTCDGFYNCEECGNTIGDPTLNKTDVWKITNEDNVSFIETSSNIKNAIEMVLDMEIGSKLTFEKIEMTKNELDSMEEFKGF